MTLIDALSKRQEEWMLKGKNIKNLIRSGKTYVNGEQVKSLKYNVTIGDTILIGKPNIDCVSWTHKE